MVKVAPIAVLLSASLMLAGGNFLLNSNRPSLTEGALAEGEIYLSGALAITPPALWVDARSHSEFTADHVPGAISLNEDQWDEHLPGVLEAWQPGQAVVVYCGSQQCRASHSVAKRLKQEVGIDEVFVLKGGWESWQKRAK